MCDTILPISPAGFFDTFISNSATCSLEAFHRNAGHFDIISTAWEQVAERDRLNSSDLMVEAAPSSREATVARSIRLVMPLEPGPFMPKQTAVEKVQKLRRYRYDVTIVEASARSHDVPYSDYFVTEDMWIILPVDNTVPVPPLERPILTDSQQSSPSGTPSRQCRFIVGVFVNFSKYTLLKAKIFSKTVEGTSIFYRGILQKVHSHIHQSQSQNDLAVSTARTNGSALTDEFISPTMAAAMANPALSISRDEIMSTWLSPRKAADASKDEILRQYTRLFTAHEVVVGQIRRMQGHQPANPVGLSMTTVALAVAAVVLAVFIALLIKSQPRDSSSVGMPPVSDDLVDELASALAKRLLKRSEW
jgi:hypothetical protein